MLLSKEEESLIRLIRALPPDQAENIFAWAAQLRDLANGRPVDWSDYWYEEDLADASSAALRRL